jgi:uncharacterized protein YqjF (DUF2071 family)
MLAVDSTGRQGMRWRVLVVTVRLARWTLAVDSRRWEMRRVVRDRCKTRAIDACCGQQTSGDEMGTSA